MENNNYKRLTRSVADRRIAGVCAGLGYYLGIDPTLVRIIFAIGIFAGLLSPIVYLLMWLIVPEDR